MSGYSRRIPCRDAYSAARGQAAVLSINRGSNFSPPLNTDELAFFDAVAWKESAVQVQREGVLANNPRAGLRHGLNIRTDWTVRDDVRAKLRSSVQRLLVKFDYPPDKAAADDPASIKPTCRSMRAGLIHGM
ncbi:type I restriction enzyme endonuclease domain-containing protein [Arthrobacter sp. TB 26]|uniref:type I restriction enzyme endonuclease domain-containing protein n=1 Tax=Arthrobacter sp. TB 26 TaxID=494420 RepID=UPI0003FE69C3|nr:type I restriction enzyme endonuclease domain-containing protein [Arthrobacter sp. TB 26]